MSMKGKFIVTGIAILLIPVIVVLMVGIALITWFFVSNPAYIQHFGPGSFLRMMEHPAFVSGLLIWAVISVFTVIASSIGALVYQSTGLVHSLNDLKESADKIKSGNLSFEVLTSRYEEVNQLCVAFEDMRKRLKEMVQLQKSYDAEKSALIANVSHDLRTPITSIKGYVEGIMDGVAATPQKQEEYLRTIYQKAEVLEELAETMGEYASYEMKRVRYDFQPLDLTAMVREFASDYKLDLESEGVDMILRIPDKEFPVLADRGKLYRVLSNVVVNAVKYRRNGESAVEIAMEDWDLGVCLSIADNGKGISREDVQKVFEGHFRADRARNSQIKGHGLGLSIAKQIMEDHKGKIWLKSEENVGTTVFLYLPRRLTL